MEQLINGRYEYEVPKLILSEHKIELSVEVGENYRGELHIGTEEDIKIKGVATVVNARIVLGTERFHGSSVRIAYGVDVTGLKPGEHVGGSINLETNIGEYQIPVKVHITEKAVRTSFGQITSLQDFVELAKTNMREAFRLFNSDSFVQLLENDAPEQVTLYGGMSRNPVTYQHLEEFLVGAEVKEPVSITVDEEEASFFNLQSSQKEILEIHRSGWGYLQINVEAMGDFIELPKKQITMDEFVGSLCNLEYIIRVDKIGSGRKFGAILLKTVYGTLKVPVVASKSSPVRVDMTIIRRRNIITLNQDYLDFRLNRIDAETWGQKTKIVLECIRQMEDFPVEYVLYEAYVNYLSGDHAAARQILRSLQDHSFAGDSLEARAFFLYLCYMTDLISQNQMDIVGKIREWQQRRQESLPILWILFQMDEDINRTPVKKIYYMENIYGMGCRSPLLYMEAYILIRRDISLLKRINGFWRSVLQFIAREDLFTEDMALRVAYLSVNERNFTKGMYTVLSKAYDSHPSADVLEAICKLIMKGNPGKKEFFRWYELAVEQDIRITRLYEYYIETMPERHQKMLPQVIRKYFAYNNTLGDKKRAFVYANVIRNKELDKNTYASYREAMEKFAGEKIIQGKISEDYAVIYQEFLCNIRKKEIAEAMAKVLFTHRLYCDDKKVRNVIVCHGALLEEEIYPCVNGVAYISLYTPGAKILFQDEKCRRYVATVEYNLQPLFEQEKMLVQCVEFDVKNPGYLLHVCGEDCRENQITIRTLSVYQHIAESDKFRENYKLQVRKKLLQYYAINAGNDTLNSYLHKMDYDQFANVDKVLLAEVLIDRGLYNEAFELICRYGQEHIADFKLVRLCSRMIDRMEGELDEELLLLAHYVYKCGKYDDVILSYLIQYFTGTVDEMCRIRTSGSNFYLDTFALDERILKYAMFVRKHISQGADVLSNYVSQGGQELVILSYLTFEAYGYFWEETKPDAYIFDTLSTAYARELDLDVVCHLALLKYYAESSALNEKQEEQVELLLEEFHKAGLRFAYFQKLPEVFTRQYQIQERIFIEQKAAPGTKVILHYTISSDKNEKTAYKHEPMKLMYRGIYSKEFILFYGETLDYYVTLERDGEVTQLPRRTSSMPSVDMEGRSTYQRINQMLAARKLGKNQVLQEKIYEYCQAKKISEELFHLIK